MEFKDKLRIAVMILSVICGFLGLALIIMLCTGFTNKMGNVAVGNNLVSMIGMIAVVSSVVGATGVFQEDFKILYAYLSFLISICIGYISIYVIKFIAIDAGTLSKKYLDTASNINKSYVGKYISERIVTCVLTGFLLFYKPTEENSKL